MFLFSFLKKGKGGFHVGATAVSITNDKLKDDG